MSRGSRHSNALQNVGFWKLSIGLYVFVCIYFYLCVFVCFCVCVCKIMHILKNRHTLAALPGRVYPYGPLRCLMGDWNPSPISFPPSQDNCVTSTWRRWCLFLICCQSQRVHLSGGLIIPISHQQWERQACSFGVRGLVLPYFCLWSHVCFCVFLAPSVLRPAANGRPGDRILFFPRCLRKSSLEDFHGMRLGVGSSFTRLDCPLTQEIYMCIYI